jgi:hypothetical protein
MRLFRQDARRNRRSKKGLDRINKIFRILKIQSVLLKEQSQFSVRLPT